MRRVRQQFPVHLVPVATHQDSVSRHTDATAQEQWIAHRIFQKRAGKQHNFVPPRVSFKRQFIYQDIIALMQRLFHRIRRYPVRFDTETANRYNNEKGNNDRYHPAYIVGTTFTVSRLIVARPVYVIIHLFPHSNLLSQDVPSGTYGSNEYRRRTNYDPYPVTARS
jgi:hypothetical protein